MPPVAVAKVGGSLSQSAPFADGEELAGSL